MEIRVSPLVALTIERRAWKDVESLSRGARDKKAHAYAVKHVKELGDIIMQIAHDEMSDEGYERQEDGEEVLLSEQYH